MRWSRLAADFAIKVLAPGGAFVAKVFQGGTEHELLAMLKQHFTTTLHAKPPASPQRQRRDLSRRQGFQGLSYSPAAAAAATRGLPVRRR